MDTRQAPFIPDLVLDKRQELESLCRTYGVVRLDLFGSATSDAFNPETSDLDFLVEFAPEFDLGQWAGMLFELEERLAVLFGRNVDLMTNTKIENPYKRRNISQSRVPVYAAQI